MRFSRHARERMTERGVSLEQVESLIRTVPPFRYFHGGIWKTGYYDPGSELFVGQLGDTITTIMAHVKPQYIESLRRRAP